MTRDWSSAPASAGYFVALLVAGALSHRLSAQTILVVAMVLFGAGLLGLALAAGLADACSAAGVLIGIGNGAIDVAANALVVDLNRERLAAALNYLHMLFGVGALMGPLIVGVRARASDSVLVGFRAAARSAVGWWRSRCSSLPRSRSACLRPRAAAS